MKGRSSAFSLVELLVVLGILALVMAFAVPALQPLLAGSSLDQGGRKVGDALLAARQEAVTKNRAVEVRFYRLAGKADRGPAWRALQAFRVEQDADDATLVPVGPVAYLPDGVVISDDPALSPLLTADSTLVATADLPGHPATPCAGFYFRPDGSTGTTLTAANNFLTVRAERAPGTSSSLPQDYYTLQVNPITGKVTSFRP